MKSYYVYILTNNPGTLYIGVTINLDRRLTEHKAGVGSDFASRYHLDKLVYFEETSNINEAIAREKQLKGWRRSKKLALIGVLNPHWHDLSIDTSTTLSMTTGSKELK